MASSSSHHQEFVPLRKKQKRASTGIEDNFVPSYMPKNPASLLSSQDLLEKAAECRLSHGIEVTGEKCPEPVLRFEDMNLPAPTMALLQRLGYEHPTPVQMQAIPAILDGRDLIVLAETGSGKTLSYSLPLCHLLPLFPPVLPGEGPRVLVMAPTRELAQQIHSYCQQFVTGLQYRLVDPKPATPTKSSYSTLLVCGGIPKRELLGDLAKGVDVVVATPGRLLHLNEEKILLLDRVSYLVVDEADRFMHGSMEEELRKVIGKVTESLRPRQTLLFSATLPNNLERLARSAVLDPIIIKVGAIGVTAVGVDQRVEFMHSYQKTKRLLETLRTTEYPPVLVFCNTITTVDQVTQLLHREQFHVAGLHSEREPVIRFEIVDALRNNKVDVCVTTDLASRGIDVPGITHVINYDMPLTIEDYVHRCGRAARWGSPGQATSFLTLECKIASELKDLLTELGQPVPPELENTRQFGGKVIKTELGDRAI